MNRALILGLFFAAAAGAQKVHRSPEIPRFMGREVTIREPEVEDGQFPKGPATVCIEGPPMKQCYTAPLDFGRESAVEVVQVQKDTAALFFSAANGGVSGWSINFALLSPGKSQRLENLFAEDVKVSNQSQHVFWSESEISEAKLFVTANYLWGPGDSHYGEHRYTISTYLWDVSSSCLWIATSHHAGTTWKKRMS